MTAGNGQYEIKESFYHLEISCRYIAEKFGAPNFNEWTNGDYIRLSSILSRTTSVQISPNTLKRIFGKLKTPERYFPQRATRDALVQYVGYKDWDNFLHAHPKPAKPADSASGKPVDGTPEKPADGTLAKPADTRSEKSAGSTTEPTISIPEKSGETKNENHRDVGAENIDHPPSAIEAAAKLQAGKSDVAIDIRKSSDIKESSAAKTELQIQDNTTRKKRLRLYYLLAGIIIILISGYFVSKQISGKQVVDLHHGISFSCKNPIGKNPHSAVFKLQLSDQFRGDESQFTIVFGDGRPDKKIRNGVIQTHYYEIPGRYYARLLYNGLPVDTIPVFLQTEGWTATATVERDSMRVYPVTADSLFTAGFLSASSEALKHSGVDTNKTFYVDFVNTHTTNIDGDNFRFSCDINTSLERAGVRCSQLMLIIYGEKSFHKVFMMKPGCEAWCNLTFSDFYRDGREDDLNFLAADLSVGGKLGLTVKNRQVSLVLNNNEIYTAGYNLPMGKIYGVKIAFSGVGKIHDVQLSDTGSGQSFNEAGLK